MKHKHNESFEYADGSGCACQIKGKNSPEKISPDKKVRVTPEEKKLSQNFHSDSQRMFPSLHSTSVDGCARPQYVKNGYVLCQRQYFRFAYASILS